ncbi:primosomal replication protein N [Rhodocyclus tenuis]|uniref:Replication restart protein PriB n=2 Tax=Rhodocyclus TaxID=1064 RepID=A0A6L5JVX8_RHOTE|nr:primosomal replication protein N [Rhodocyclus gracilis]NJA89899.1 primosomal replication protein N [Rhodocyclus gracilis]
MNRVTLAGVLVERKALRFTPAGVPVAECLVRHQSVQVEAGAERRVECDVQAIGLGPVARWLNAAPPGATVRIEGFLAARSANSRQLRLHIHTIEFVEGNQNGQVLQEEG